MTQHSVLILFAHPALERSRVNRRLAEAVRALPDVTFHDLYEVYPDFDVDPPREQRLLAEHHSVVLQYPLYWYSTPALVKQWLDLVLEHGWAYGRDGHALQGKRLLLAITSGGPAQAYQRQGLHGHTLDDLLLPMKRTAVLCGMSYEAPFITHDAHRMADPDIERHAERYCRRIESLRER